MNDHANLKKFTFEFDVSIVFTGGETKKNKNIVGVEFTLITELGQVNEQCRTSVKHGFFPLQKRIVDLFRENEIKHTLHSDEVVNFRWKDNYWNGNVDVFLESSAFEDPPYFEEDKWMECIRSDGTFIPTQEKENERDVEQTKSWYPVSGARVKSIGKLVFVISCPTGTPKHMSAARGREAYPPRKFSLQNLPGRLEFPRFVEKTKLVNLGYYTLESEMENGAVYGEYVMENNDVIVDEVFRYTRDDDLPFTELIPDDEEGSRSSFDTDTLVEKDTSKTFKAYVGFKKLSK